MKHYLLSLAFLFPNFSDAETYSTQNAAVILACETWITKRIDDLNETVRQSRGEPFKLYIFADNSMGVIDRSKLDIYEPIKISNSSKNLGYRYGSLLYLQTHGRRFNLTLVEDLSVSTTSCSN